jgi:hypothetical protein
MNNILDTLKRNLIWIILLLSSILLLKPAIEEFNTILLIILFESIALALSSIAAFVYTRIDFVRLNDSKTLGYLFLSVHLAVGLMVIGFYIAQFSGV